MHSTKNELRKFFSFKKKFSKNEISEDIEILRFLELDIPVKMVKVSGSSIAVDIKSDIKKVESYLRKNEKNKIFRSKYRQKKILLIKISS